jgi:hypothetical protein
MMQDISSLYNNYTVHLYYQLNEMLKTYRVYESFDSAKAKDLLKQINDLRLAIALIAEQRQIFWAQLEIEANNTGYKNDVYFTSDDIKSLVSRLIANLEIGVTFSLIQQGSKKQEFTRQQVPYQQIASAVQSSATGQNIPFDLPQEIFLDKNDSLDIGVVNQTTAGQIIVHGANLKDDYTPNVEAIKNEIWSINRDGSPNLPTPVLVPILFKFLANTLDAKAVAIDSGKNIFSQKGEKSVILTDVSTTSINSRISLIDTGRNHTLCNEVESQGIAGFHTNRFTSYYPLPYWHLLRQTDRFQLEALNGSIITGVQDAVGTYTICFRGFTI